MHNYFDNLPCAYKKICHITDDGHTKGSIPNSLRPKFKFKSQSQMNIWDMDIKALFFVEIMIEE